METVILLKVVNIQNHLFMRHVMLKNSLTMWVLRLLLKLRIVDVSNGWVLQTILSEMNNNGEIQNYRWVLLLQSLTPRRGKCRRKCKHGIYHQHSSQTFNAVHKIYARYWDLVRMRRFKDEICPERHDVNASLKVQCRHMSFSTTLTKPLSSQDVWF